MAYHPGCEGDNGGAAASSQFYEFQARKQFPLLSRLFIVYNDFRTLIPNDCSPQRKGDAKMSAVDTLVKYILTLTPEQVDKVVSQLPRLTGLLSESSQPCLQEPSKQSL